VDAQYKPILLQFKWRAVQAKRSWYAKANIVSHGKTITIAMHRFIARTPTGKVCHHKNGNSLDNRKMNLENMGKKSHDLYHKNNNLLIKYEDPSGPEFFD